MSYINIEVDVYISDAIDKDEEGFVKELEYRGYYLFKPKTLDDKYKLELFQELYGKYTSEELELLIPVK